MKMNTIGKVSALINTSSYQEQTVLINWRQGRNGQVQQRAMRGTTIIPATAKMHKL